MLQVVAGDITLKNKEDVKAKIGEKYPKAEVDFFEVDVADADDVEAFIAHAVSITLDSTWMNAV